MPQLGVPELLIILVIIILVFGVGKLPQIGEALGKGIRNFKRATSGEDTSPPQQQLETQSPQNQQTAPPARQLEEKNRDLESAQKVASNNKIES